MGKKQDLVKKGKQLSFLLRHDTEYRFDEHGYREVLDLVQNHGFTKDEIVELVETNDKQRYEFNDDKSKIRARQGHSVNINVDLKETLPPDVLFHGTATRFLDSIIEKGILKMSRNYVQLSENIDTATEVGKRHGKPVILTVNTKAMREDGIKFYLSNNNVWLTEFVDSKYIVSILEDNRLKYL
jgi:putative RNA 2'-phosphotransferase